MKTRPSAAARCLFTCTAMFMLLTCAVTTYGVDKDCAQQQPNDAENLLTDLLLYPNRPIRCPNKWYTNIDPSFRSFPGGSQNLPVVAAALGLYKNGPNGADAYLDWHSGGAVGNPTGYRIKYGDWWIWYLASQVGEDPKAPMYLGASFPVPPEGSALKYFKGTEEFSNIYDTADAVAVVAVRYWVYKYGGQMLEPNKATALKNLTRKFLRVHWALYGMAAGEGPVDKYDLGRVNPDPSASPIPPRTPVPGLGKTTNTQFDPDAPRKNGRYVYTGHFIALAGARSHLGGQWNFDYRFPLFDRAIGQPGTMLQKPPAEVALLDRLQALWAELSSRPPDENLYGLTSDDQANLKALLNNCYDPASSNPQICGNIPSTPTAQDWLKTTFQPWLGNIRVSTTYRILGASGWRASQMENNTNGNTTNVYAVYYNKNAVVDGVIHPQATYLFPWNDADGGIPGDCSFNPGTGLITAHHGVVKRPNRQGVIRTVHPELTVYMNIPTSQPFIQLLLTRDGPPVFGPPPVVAKSGTNVFTPYGTAFGNDEVWVGNTVPEGGVPQSGNENWNWVADNPFPYTEATLVHLSSAYAGVHQHLFTGATDSLTINAGETLYAYVYLDPVNPPTEVMLQWFDPSVPGGEWEHRAYWGANQIGWGVDGQNSRRYMGSLPVTGDWIRLEVPASLVGLEGRTVTGMAFTLYNGAAAWDRAGKTTLLTPSVNLAVGSAATQSSTYTATPYGGPASLAVDGSTNGNFFSGSLTHTNADYQAWWQVDLGASYPLDTVNLWNRTDCCAERLSNFYLLVSDQSFTSTDLNATLNQPGVLSYYVGGPVGNVLTLGVGRTGRYVRVQLVGTNYLSLAEVEVVGQYGSMPPLPPPPQPTPTPTPTPTLPPGDIVWVEDSVPAGTTNVSNGWNWVASNPAPVSGASSHQTLVTTGADQHFFTGATNTLTVNTGDKLFTYVYLDPQNPPSEIMLQWYENNSWEHRAYWGANLITSTGIDGMDSRRYMGALPPTGQWWRLEVPASQVGLEGRTLSGMAFTLFNGRVTWDRSGKNAQSALAPPPAGDTVWIEDGLPSGAVPAVEGGDSWFWIGSGVLPGPASGSLAHQSNIFSDRHQHYFTGATSTLTINTGDKLVAYVYLDPQNPPSEIMLQWDEGGATWGHRAYWGANSINFGTDGQPSRYYMGSLPAAGQWIRLEVPASKVGLEGRTVTGMAFTLYGGRATWDHVGKKP
jgi:hypothetical protein